MYRKQAFTIGDTLILLAGISHTPPNTIRTRFPVDQRQKAGEKSEGWKLPSCGRLTALFLLLVNKSSLAHHDDAIEL